MIASVDLLTEGLEERVRQLAASARQSLFVVAPFIKARVLERILAAIGQGVKITCVTRWRPEEVAAGVSDLEVLGVCADAGARLLLLDRLHAKLYASERGALVGSANLTGAGLGERAVPNLEILVEVEPRTRSFALLVASIEAEARAATVDERDRVAAAAAVLPRARFEPCAADPLPDGPWLPRFRSPDRLFAEYERLEDEGRCHPDALADLAALRIGPELAAAQFEAAVTDRLRSRPVFAAVEEFVSTPRRFGELTAWVAWGLPGSDRAERQRAAQTLIRWLTRFGGGRFRLDVPNHSEILGLTDRKT